MEALTGVSAGLLCALDMVKSLEKDSQGQYPDTVISQIRVIEKFKSQNKSDRFIDGIDAPAVIHGKGF